MTRVDARKLEHASSEPLRILLVAYRFPPQGGGGVQRPAKLVKYWSQAGHKIAVLTSHTSTVPLEDQSLLRDIPEEVERIVVEDPSLHRRLQEIRRRATNPMIRRLLFVPLYLVSHLTVPDLVSGWRRPAILKGREALKTFSPNVIVVTGPPWTSFLVGASLAATADVPLVLDYRDPWTQTYLRLEAGALCRLLNPRIERGILRRAHGVVGGASRNPEARTTVRRSELPEVLGS